jgi:CRP/FNR family transcriptional regulator, dissimilatory nitrate respiration regulator
MKSDFMEYAIWSGVLQSSPLFHGIGSEELACMLGCLKPRIKRYRNRDIIAVYGQPFDGVGIVLQGQVALTRDTSSGERVLMGVLGPREVFGEMVAFSASRIWPVTVIAREECLVAFLPPDKIVGNCPEMCPGHSRLINNMLGILSRKALDLNRKMEHLMARKLRGRISSYLLDESRRQGKTVFRLPMKRHELADYLNMPRPSLSREMGLMRDEGLIRFQGAQVEIDDLPALEKATE